MSMSSGSFSSGSPQHAMFVVKFGRQNSVMLVGITHFGGLERSEEGMRKEVESWKRGI